MCNKTKVYCLILSSKLLLRFSGFFLVFPEHSFQMSSYKKLLFQLSFQHPCSSIKYTEQWEQRKHQLSFNRSITSVLLHILLHGIVFHMASIFCKPQFNWLAVGREMSIKAECVLNYNRILHIHKMGSGFYVCMLNLFYTFCACKNCEWNVMHEQKHIAYGQVLPVCT